MAEDKRLRALIARFNGIVNQLNKLDSKPYDLGIGEKLYRSEMHILQAVGRGEGRTVSELALAFDITKGAVSQIVGKLAKKGYISKERNPAYSKELILSLSEKGRAAFKAHEALHAKSDRAFIKHMGPIPEREIKNFERMLLAVEEYIRLMQEK